MTGRVLLPAVLLTAVLSLRADPVDTAYDLMEAIEYRDGYALEDLLSQDLYAAIDGFLEQVRGMIETDPVLAGNLLEGRYSGSITIDDFRNMTNQEILGRVMGEVRLLPLEQVESETARLEGRNAVVVISYFGGASVSFDMTWEDGGWRVTDSSLLGEVFR